MTMINEWDKKNKEPQKEQNILPHAFVFVRYQKVESNFIL